MNRRGFLGFLGAGAVAGPAVAKNALTDVYPVMGKSVLQNVPALIRGGSEITKSSLGHGVMGTIDRISQLQRLISGEEDVQEDPYSVAWKKQRVVEHNINALGSVSQVRKMAIALAANDKIEREKQKKYWLQELMNLGAE